MVGDSCNDAVGRDGGGRGRGPWGRIDQRSRSDLIRERVGSGRAFFSFLPVFVWIDRSA